MKEIKFRAWDEKNKCFLKCGEFTEYFISFNGGCVKWDGGFDLLETVFNCIIEDFTGLTDKNGKGIYEGDILSRSNYPYIDNGKQNYVATVEWIFAGFQTVLHCVNNKKRGISEGINDYLEDADEYEVIGNIHENPELMEVK